MDYDVRSKCLYSTLPANISVLKKFKHITCFVLNVVSTSSLLTMENERMECNCCIKSELLNNIFCYKTRLLVIVLQILATYMND